MKRILLAIMTLALPLTVNAGAASQIAWTPDLLARVKSADVNNGKRLAASCNSCHGDSGQGAPAIQQDGDTIAAVPALAGQVANYTYKQLRDYANGDRVDMAMTSVAKGLSEQDAADVAAWFSTLPKIDRNTKRQDLVRAEKLVEQGDGKRIVPPCFVCHGGKGQGEKQDIPALAGQHADYVTTTLMAYKNGQRQNDIYSRMRLIAQQLSAEEIKELAQYYQQLK
jgi:cytochrome c553